MSALAGICHWDGRPVPDSFPAAFAKHSCVSGSGGGTTLRPLPGLLLQSYVERFDQLSATEKQPWIFGQGSALMWDGRLDNRDDLLAQLHHGLGAEHTDVALVAAAYDRWGEECLPRLLGDWSVAIWDAQRRAIILARDYMGNRPLYYAQWPNGLAWATRLEALAESLDLYGKPDESFIAGTLTRGVPSHLTPFSGLLALRAGHVLAATERSEATIRRYWAFTPSTIRYADSRSYTERLRELLTEAVRVRLRADRTVWSHLSGGWDSSTVVCLGDLLVRRGVVETPALQPISMVCSASPESDQSYFINAVESWCNLRSVRREFQGYYRVVELLNSRIPLSTGPRHTFEVPVKEAGDLVVLSGGMGDAVMFHSGVSRLALLQPLHHGDLLGFARICAIRARHMKRPLLATFAQLAALTYSSIQFHESTTQRRIDARHAKDMGVSPHNPAAAYGVTPPVLARAPHRHSAPDPSLNAFSSLHRRLVADVYSFAERGLVSNSEFVPYFRYTYPFTHRPLIEFVLAVPPLTLWDPRVPRAGMKQALSGILPTQVLERTTKGNPDAILTRAARDRTEDLADDVAALGPLTGWELVRRGDVELPPLRVAAADARAGRVQRQAFLTKCIHLEAWLRALGTVPRMATGRRLAVDSKTLAASPETTVRDVFAR
jgi:asparagine synthase (glutamine-hydrolysing)